MTNENRCPLSSLLNQNNPSGLLFVTLRAHTFILELTYIIEKSSQNAYMLSCFIIIWEAVLVLFKCWMQLLDAL